MIIKRMFLFYWKTFVLIIVRIFRVSWAATLRITVKFRRLFVNLLQFYDFLFEVWLNNSSSYHVVSSTEINFAMYPEICVNLMSTRFKLIDLQNLNFVSARDTNCESRSRINQIHWKGWTFFMLARHMKFWASHKLKKYPNIIDRDMIQAPWKGFTSSSNCTAFGRNFEIY